VGLSKHCQQLDFTALNNRITDKLVRTLNENVSSSFMVPSWYLPGETRESPENLPSG
jgi:hypothetical protein